MHKTLIKLQYPFK